MNVDSIYLIIKIASIVFVSIIAGLAALLFYKIGQSSNRENIDLAWIEIDNSGQISKPIKGKIVKLSNSAKGAKYAFRYMGRKKEVFVPKTYKIKFQKSRRKLYLDSRFSLIALPNADDKPLTSSAREDLLFEVTSSQLVAQAVNAMKGKAVGMVVLIIVFIVALLLGIGATYFTTRKAPTISSNTTINRTIQPPITKPPI